MSLPTPTAIPASTPTAIPTSTPAATAIPTPDVYYMNLKEGTVTGVKKIDDEKYECTIEYDETSIEAMKEYFPDCVNMKYIMCISSKERTINSKVRLAIEKKRYKYVVVDDTTVKLTEKYNID